MISFTRKEQNCSLIRITSLATRRYKSATCAQCIILRLQQQFVQLKTILLATYVRQTFLNNCMIFRVLCLAKPRHLIRKKDPTVLPRVALCILLTISLWISLYTKHFTSCLLCVKSVRSHTCKYQSGYNQSVCAFDFTTKTYSTDCNFSHRNFMIVLGATMWPQKLPRREQTAEFR